MKTGLYTSPHIATFRERIQIDGKYISAEDVEDILPDVFEKCEANNIPATFFEYTTALAFRKFVESNCDVVVLEVGLGGRLDATNVIGRPALSVITAIQYDHMATLGDNLNDIALEKGGIIKPDAVYGVLVGPGCPHDVLQQTTFEVNKSLNYYQIDDADLLPPADRLYPQSQLKDVDVKADLSRAGRPLEVLPKVDIDWLNTDIARAAVNILSGDNYFYGRNNDVVDDSYILIRRYQMLNDCLAALKPEQLTRALSVRPPCRFERLCVSTSSVGGALHATPHNSNGGVTTQTDIVEVVLDLAHNEGAIASLIEKLRCVYGDGDNVRFRFVVGMASDKDVRACVEVIHASGVINSDSSQLYCVEAQHPRALSRAELKDIVCDIMGDGCGTILSSPEQRVENVAITLRGLIEEGLQSQADGGPKEVVVVFGTAFIMADCKKTLGCYNITSSSGEVVVDQELADDFEMF